MDRIFWFFLLLFSLPLSAQVKWLSMEQAVHLQDEKSKKLLIFFTESSCESCKIMLKSTFNHPEILSIIEEKFYPVLIDVKSPKSIVAFGKEFSGASPMKGAAAGRHEFSQFLNITSLPSLVFTDEQSMPLTTIQGSLSPKELEPYLSFFGSEQYENINSKQNWEQQRKKLRSRIRE